MSAEPDIRVLREQTLPPLEFPGGRNQEFRVAMDPGVHAEIWKHGTQDTTVEICGVLVGKLGRDASGPFLHVSASIRGEAAANKLAEVTFTHETWNKINQEMDTKYADRSIVGWYHTHPNFGIFLSERDQFICQHFFSGPGQVAHVVDPIRKQEGVFIWRGGKPAPIPCFWVGDRLLMTATDGADKPAPGMVPPAASPPSGDAPAVPWWMHSMIILTAFLIGYLLSGGISEYRFALNRRQILAELMVQQGLRPGLGPAIRATQRDFQDLHTACELISQEHLTRVNASKESDELKQVMKVTWGNVLAGMRELRGRLRSLEELYCLTPDEEATLEALMESQRKRQPPEAPKDDKAGQASGKTPPERTTEKPRTKKSVPSKESEPPGNTKNQNKT